MNKKKKLIEAVDLFSGVGGLTYGLNKSGIKVLAGIDNDKTCQYAYEKNNNAKFILSDIAECDFKEIKKLYSKDSFKVLVGCAPCQPFSAHSNKIKDKNDDKRWNLLDHFVRAIDIIKPDIVSMENVRGVTKTDVFANFVKSLELLGYAVDYDVVYAPNYGVPQNRSRLILLASKKGRIKVPERTHSKDDYITVKDVIQKIPRITAGQVYSGDALHQSRQLSDLNIKRIKQSRPGGTWRDWDEQLLPECYKRSSGKTYSSVYGRMKWDDVSPTITTQFTSFGSGRFGHPDQDRAISVREGALFQTFPMNYDFGSIPLNTICRHIGNAVPPRLGDVIGATIKKHIYA